MPSRPALARPATRAGLAALGAAISVAVQATPLCRASGEAIPVVELYTSEGCSSCPPADRFLSTLRGRSDVLALGFHVDYWDRLGWPDRFASAEHTRRQYMLAQGAGRAQVYTPQVLVSGRDWRGWPQWPATLPPPSGTPSLELARSGERFTVQVGTAVTPVAGYWVVLEDGHTSRVRAGENRGETLRHDHVVRLYRPVAAGQGSAFSASLEVSVGEAAHPRRVAFVLTDATLQRPLRAAVLPMVQAGC